MKTNSPPTEQVGPFQLFILVLTIAVFGMLVADTFLKLPPEVSTLLRTIDTFVCIVFLIDFGVRLYRAPDKVEFMKWNWIDLAASIPEVEFLRLGRFVRLLRIIRLLRAVRSSHRLLNLLLKQRFQSGIASVSLMLFLLLTFSSVAILFFERSPEASIKTAGDAVWWSVCSLTTVGYGDVYPISFEGRVLAMIVLLCGVGLFGTVSGMMASFFVGDQGKEEEEAEQEILQQLAALNERVASLQQQLQANKPAPPAG